MTLARVRRRCVGTGQCYRNGCRNADCRVLANEDKKKLVQARRAERELVYFGPEHGWRLVHPRANHGKEHGYNYYGCRCPRCTEAHRVGIRGRK